MQLKLVRICESSYARDIHFKKPKPTSFKLESSKIGGTFNYKN